MHINHQPPPPPPPAIVEPGVVPGLGPLDGSCVGDNTVPFTINLLGAETSQSGLPVFSIQQLAEICQTVVILTASPTGQPGKPTTPNLGSGVWLTNDDGSTRIFTANHVIPNGATSVQIYYPTSTIFQAPSRYQQPNANTDIDLACAGNCRRGLPILSKIEEVMADPHRFHWFFAGAPYIAGDEARIIHIYNLGRINDGVFTNVSQHKLDQSVKNSPYSLEFKIDEQAIAHFGSLPGASGGPLFAIDSETGEMYVVGLLTRYLPDPNGVRSVIFVTFSDSFQVAQNDVPSRFLDPNSILQLLQADPSQDLAYQPSETLNAHLESNLFDRQFKYIFDQIKTNLINQYPQIDPNQINILAHALTSSIWGYDPLAVYESDDYLSLLLDYPITADQKAQIGYTQWIIDALLEQGYAYWQIADPTQLIPNRPITGDMDLVSQYAKLITDKIGLIYGPKVAFVNETLLWVDGKHPNQKRLTILQQNAFKMCQQVLSQNTHYIKMTNPGVQGITLNGTGSIYSIILDYPRHDTQFIWESSESEIQAYRYDRERGRFAPALPRRAQSLFEGNQGVGLYVFVPSEKATATNVSFKNITNQ